MQEIEIKLAFPKSNTGNVTSALVEKLGKPEFQYQLANLYFDTPDLSLRKQRWALRVRAIDGADYEQTVKGQGRVSAGLHSRIEHNWPIQGPEIESGLLSEVESFPSAVAADLQEIFRTDFDRTGWLVQTSEYRIELVLDQGNVIQAGQLDPIAEIELELKQGDVGDLIDLAKQIVSLAPCWLFSPSKAARGYSLMKCERFDLAVELEEIDSLMAWVDVAGRVALALSRDELLQLQDLKQLGSRIVQLTDTQIKLDVSLSGKVNALAVQDSLSSVKHLLLETNWLGQLGVAVLEFQSQTR